MTAALSPNKQVLSLGTYTTGIFCLSLFFYFLLFIIYHLLSMMYNLLLSDIVLCIVIIHYLELGESSSRAA